MGSDAPRVDASMAAETLKNLKQRDVYLTRVIEEAGVERQQIRRAIDALEPLAGVRPMIVPAAEKVSVQVPGARHGREPITISQIIAYAASLGPNARIELDGLTRWAIANGWKTEALDPKQSMAQALGRAAKRGHVRKAYNGVYFTNPPPGEEPPDEIGTGRADLAVVVDRPAVRRRDGEGDGGRPRVAGRYTNSSLEEALRT